MKTQILNCITAKKSINFEKKVARLLPKEVTEIYLSSCGMERLGTGSYNYFLQFSINNGSVQKITSHTHSSPAWDDWRDIEAGTRKHDNFNKSVCLMLLEENKQFFVELFEEEK